jgi:di/tricarboxylate transporter
MEPVGLMGVLGGFVLLTVLLSIPMSNAAAALVMLPIALQTAQKLGSDPHTFGIAIMLAASLSFIGPFEPACVLVYGPGKYRFRDFVIAGTGLTLILVVVVLVMLPVLWPL